MSIVLRITANAFDGTTVVDLSSAVLDPATQIFEATFPLAGVIPLWTFAPVGARDIWLQEMSSPDPVVMGMRFPSGAADLALQANQPNPFNTVLPQGAVLVFAAAPPTSVTLWLYGINDKIYAPLACCHQFNPKLEVQPPPP